MKRNSNRQDDISPSLNLHSSDEEISHNTLNNNSLTTSSITGNYSDGNRSAAAKPQSSAMSATPHKPDGINDVDTVSGTGNAAVAISAATDEEIEEDVPSISEHISMNDSNIDSDVSAGASASGANKLSALAVKKRQLFNIDSDDDDDLIGARFKLDDRQLSGGQIAQHFQVEKESEDSVNEEQNDDGSLDITPSKSKEDALLPTSDKNSLSATHEYINKTQNVEEEHLQQQQQPIDIPVEFSSKLDRGSVDESGAKEIIAQGAAATTSDLMESKPFGISTTKLPSNKDISPFKEDVILINNDKISLNSLKKMQLPPLAGRLPPLQLAPLNDDSSTTNQNTTNDISDIVCDDDITLSYLVDDKPRMPFSKAKSCEQDHPVKVHNSKICHSLNSSFKFDNTESETLAQNTPPRSKDSSYEEDHSIEELILSNASIDKSTLHSNAEPNSPVKSHTDSFFNLSEVDSNVGIMNESQINKILSDTIDNLPKGLFTDKNESPDSLDLLADGIMDLKDRILEHSDKSAGEISKTKLVHNYSFELATDKDDSPDPQQIPVIKQMEKIEYSTKEALEDISEESDLSLEPKATAIAPKEPTIEELQERGSEFRKILQSNQMIMTGGTDTADYATTFVSGDEANANSFDSVISLQMLQAFENKIKELEDIVATKDVCLMALNMQLNGYGLRESLKETPALDSCSLMTNSTEYITYQDDYPNKAFDFQSEINGRELIIHQLTDTLQQSLQVREQLQHQSDKLTAEVVLLRKQLGDSLDLMRRPHWLRDQESVGGGQRISEISIDLVSESDMDDVDDGRVQRQQQLHQPHLTDSEDKSHHSSRERQTDGGVSVEPPLPQQVPILKQIEQFQKYLSTDEQRIFFMVQNKFNDYLCQEVEKVRCKYDGDMKVLGDNIETEKHEKDSEINRLRQLLAGVKGGTPEIAELRRELDVIHGREMADLRTYFERKCADLEKQYSEDIFSQHSRRHSNDTGSELSDQEQLPHEPTHSHHGTPKRKTKLDILASPTHRKITPTSIGDMLNSATASTKRMGDISMNVNDSKDEDQDPMLSITEVEAFYREKIAEINKNHEHTVRMLKFRLKRFETRNADDEYMSSSNTADVVVEDEDDDETAHKDIPINTNNDSQVINQIIQEYERRLKEQVDMAQLDILNALQEQIQAFLSETATDDSQWPPELILLREKFTAKSQLEIAQLQIKHKDEMDRLKSEYEIHMNRKMKRHTKFDGNRDIDQIVLECDNLRELCGSFRWLLSELAKCVSVCEEDLNKTLLEELHKHGIEINNTTLNGVAQIEDTRSVQSDDLNDSVDSSTKRRRFAPDVTGILNVIEDQSLLDFVGQSKDSSFNLNECVDRLKMEAIYLLELSENLCKRNRSMCKASSEKDDSCEEEDGLKRKSNKKNRLEQTNSLNENVLVGRKSSGDGKMKERSSLPSNCLFGADENRSISSNSELNGQLNDLRNRLLISENERQNLRIQLEDAIKKHDNLADIFNMAKEHLEHLEAQKEDISEGYGISQLKSPSRQLDEAKTSYSDLQNMARSILNGAPNATNEDGTVLLQHIEDFCSKLDGFVDEEKKSKNDLQEQVDVMEQQIKDMTLKMVDYDEKKQKLETDQKASIDKIFDLREVIADLESQVETKALTEQVLAEKVKSLEKYVDSQNHTNESLHGEIESLKTEYVANYREKIANLEEQLRVVRPTTEHSSMVEQFGTQLKEIELALDRKTRTLEALHSDICSASCSTPSEDVSVKELNSNANSPAMSPRSPLFLPVDDVQRIMGKLIKHNRAEEAAIKRIRDLEMHIASVRTAFDELQHERDVLQEKMSEQVLRISSLQSRLDEQRHRAEELHRKGTSDLSLKVYDLQSQLSTVQEKLTAREKQIVTLNNHLEQSKEIIDRLENELALVADGGDNHVKVDKLEAELRIKCDENQKLKEKIRNEMISKLALPDLMETMLSEKIEEIDHIKEQLDSKQKQLQIYLDLNLSEYQLRELQQQQLQKPTTDFNDGKLSARTLSDIVSLTDFDEEPDVIRKAADTQFESSFPSKFFANNKATINEISTNPTPISLIPGISPTNETFMQLPQPRKINFSLPEHSNSADNKQLEMSLTVPELDATPQQWETKLMEMRNEIRILQDRLTVCSKFEGEVDNLKASLELNSNEKSSLARELTEQRQSAASLRIDLAAESKMITDVMTEKKILQTELSDMKLSLSRLQIAQSENKSMQEELSKSNSDFDDLTRRFKEKSTEIEDLIQKMNSVTDQVDILNHQVQSLNKTISHKDEMLSKHEKNAINYAQNETRNLEKINNLEQEIALLKCTGDLDLIEPLKQELEDTKAKLFEKMIDYEKCLLDIQEIQKLVPSHLRDTIFISSATVAAEFETSKCKQLEKEVEILREALRHNESSVIKPFQLDDIAESVEKELNYSAQLDSNILKAIESDEINSDEDARVGQKYHGNDGNSELMAIKQKYEIERSNCLRLQRLLDAEKRNSGSLQEQDAHIIEAMRLRLEAALEQETQLQKIIDDERAKTERLATQLLVYQRSSSRDNSLTLKSPQESPRRIQRNNDIDTELVNRLRSEVKLLTAQNERERERVMDIERVMEREKHRIEKELVDRKDYGERIKREMDRVLKEKDSLANELEHAQERLQMSAREIESFEARISHLQEAESRRASRRGKERNESTQNAVDVHELRLKLVAAERERDSLNEKVTVLRGDIERGAQREAQLTEALVKEHSGDGIVPKQFLQKLSNIVENTKEYRQMADTLQCLTQERQTLQQRVDDLELRNRAFNRDELEKRANHLFGKYLRVESYRKALVHQKRYLIIILQTYQENEEKALTMLYGNHPPRRKRRSFRSVATVIIAIQRMKYMVKRWQVGKRVGSEAIFSNNLPRRSASANTNHWVRTDFALNGQSPPCRDRPPHHGSRATLTAGRPLQAPSLIAECSERLENLASSTTNTWKQPWR